VPLQEKFHESVFVAKSYVTVPDPDPVAPGFALSAFAADRVTGTV
jgi:hypothetical protein